MKSTRPLTSSVIIMILSVYLTLPPVTAGGRHIRHAIHTSGHPPSPCLYTEDEVYGGVLVDCRRMQLTSFPPIAWIPPATTTLFLQDNSIADLKDNSSLQNATELRFLSMANNTITAIHHQAFRFNKNLRVLDLEHNHIYLDDQSIQQPLFYNLHNLTELKLRGNKNEEQYDASYPSCLLLGLFNLRTLTLDTFYDDLDFNNIFNRTQKLTKLVLGGGLVSIKNDSFQGFDSIKLTNLSIIGAMSFEFTDTGAFQYLKYLDSYIIKNVSQGTKPTLESLAPFVNRNFTELRFIRHGGKPDPDQFKRDSELSLYIARYLSQICVKHFAFVNFNLFFLEPRAVRSQIWSHCLVSFDISTNPLISPGEMLLGFSVLRSLQFFTMRDRKYSFLSIKQLGRKGREYFEPLPNNQIRKKNGIMHIRLPRKLVYINLNGLTADTCCTLDYHIIFTGGEHLETLYASDSGLIKLTGVWEGLDNLNNLDISQNDGSDISAPFLNSFPRLSKLVMSRMYLNKRFTSKIYEPIFHNLHRLEHLDLSHNGIFYLPTNLLSNNKMLQHLNLAGNRLSEFPLKLALFPSLSLLDIGENSFHQLSNDDTTALENYAWTHPNFSIILDGNIFSCSCYSIRFLKWLRVTRVDLKNDRNYTCTLEDGQLSWTNNIPSIEGKWRECEGRNTFLASIALLILAILGYPLVFLCCTKLKTQITASFYNFFNSDFAFKSPMDYPWGVYIGYCDRDSEFVTFLNKFVTDRLKLKTFVRYQNLLPGMLITPTIVEKINSSWRIMLVFTEDYLQDPLSHLAVIAATHAVDPSNPGRLVIVVLSEDNDDGTQPSAVENKIPDYMLELVREDSIIRINNYDPCRGNNYITEPQCNALRGALLG